MSPRILTLTNSHQKLLADLRNTMNNLREQGKVWVSGEDSAIQLDSENLDLSNSVFCFEENGLEIVVRNKNERKEEASNYSLSRCNITDLIDLLAILETYGKPYQDDALRDLIGGEIVE